MLLQLREWVLFPKKWRFDLFLCHVVCVPQVCKFIGLASYYRQFVPKFAKIASPLHALLKEDNAFPWSLECFADFTHLVFPKFGPGSEFIMETDTSYIGLRAVLSQQ